MSQAGTAALKLLDDPMSEDVFHWWRQTEAAWRAGDRRRATRYLLEVLQLDPDLDQIAWNNLLYSDRADMSGVPASALEEVRAIVKSMGPSAVRTDTPAARATRLQLVAEIRRYLDAAQPNNTIEALQATDPNELRTDSQELTREPETTSRPPLSVSREVEDQILDAAVKGDTVQAIRLAREHLRMAFSEAKEFVEGLQSTSLRLPRANTTGPQSCPGCGATKLSYSDKYDLSIFRCTCDRIYCDECSGGGLIDLPRCPVSAYHEGMRKIGEVRRA